MVRLIRSTIVVKKSPNLPAIGLVIISLSFLPLVIRPSVAVAQSASGAANDEGFWDPRFFHADTPPIETLVIDASGNLYVGGDFGSFGGHLAGSVARWDGKRWSGLGTTLRGRVVSIAADDAGNLYAGGYLSLDGDERASRVVHWDGSRWSTMGTLGTPFNTLVVDAAGTVYAGTGNVDYSFRSFRTNFSGLVRWDGTQWIPLIEKGMVPELAVDDAGRVYAYGYENSRDHLFFRAWDPKAEAWVNMGNPSGLLNPSSVRDMVIDTTGALVLSGRTRVIRWNGTTWEPLGEPTSDDRAPALAIDPDGTLFRARGRSVPEAGRTISVAVEQWEGQMWTVVDTLRLTHTSGDATRVIGALRLAVDDRDGIYLGGLFQNPDTGLRNLLYRDNTSWTDIVTDGWGADDDVSVIISNNGNVYVGGSFTRIGGVAAAHIARWDGTEWSPLGGGTDGSVLAIAVAPDGRVYAGGRFETAGGTAAAGVAVWDGVRWSGLGNGLDGASGVLAVDNDGAIYVGGGFARAGDIEALNIARWDGTAWSALGAGLNASVRAIVAAGPDSLFAGGYFTASGGQPMLGIARWDGTTWSPVGGSLTFDGGPSRLHVEALELVDGGVYAGGVFTGVGGVDVNHLAFWDGTHWSPTGVEDDINGVNAGLRSVARDFDGNLYVCGDFGWAASTLAWQVARWDGEHWHALGAGIQGPYSRVQTVAIDRYGAALFGGRFSIAGDVGSANIARWIPRGSDLPETPHDELAIDWSVYPNPLGNRATVELVGVNDPWVQVAVYDVLGQRVARLFDGPLLAGFTYSFTLDATQLPGGVYVVQIRGERLQASRTVVHTR